MCAARTCPPGGAGYAALDREAAAVPLGCEGVTFLPFLAGAPIRTNVPARRGAFYGARLSTTRAHLARSVMESAAFMIRDFLSDLERLGCPAREVRSLGGGARSAVWLQMKADICGRVFRVSACTEAAAQGAALLAGWGSGLIAHGEVPPPREAAALCARPRPRRAGGGCPWPLPPPVRGAETAVFRRGTGLKEASQCKLKTNPASACWR